MSTLTNPHSYFNLHKQPNCYKCYLCSTKQDKLLGRATVGTDRQAATHSVGSKNPQKPYTWHYPATTCCYTAQWLATIFTCTTSPPAHDAQGNVKTAHMASPAGEHLLFRRNCRIRS